MKRKREAVYDSPICLQKLASKSAIGLASLPSRSGLRKMQGRHSRCRIKFPPSVPIGQMSGLHAIVLSNLKDLPRKPKIFRLLSGFSGGLVTGLLVSTLLAAAFLLHSHRRRLGESLIHLGERLGARSQLDATLPPMQVAPAQGQTVSPAPITALPREKLVPHPVTTVVKPQPVESEAPKQVAATPVPGPPATRTLPAISPFPPPDSLPTLTVVPKVPTLPDTYGAVTLIEKAKPPSGQPENSRGGTVPSISQMYLEVGKFKDKLWAHRTSGELTQLNLGFMRRLFRKAIFGRIPTMYSWAPTVMKKRRRRRTRTCCQVESASF
jgi:hypothetical protein